MDDFIQTPTEAQGFRVAAQAMLAGAGPLLQVDPVPNIALTLLCGHGTEAALKALLSESGLTAEELSEKPYGHKLVTLWGHAAARGCPLPMPVPEWVEHLNRVHAYPYSLRYPLKFHAIVLPNQNAMLAGLEFLVGKVNEVVQ
jgi:hypothetical protein